MLVFVPFPSFLELRVSLQISFHLLRYRKGCLCVFVFQQVVGDLYFIDIVFVLHFCIVFDHDCAHLPIREDLEADSVHMICINQNILSYKSNYFLYFPFVIRSPVPLLVSVSVTVI